MVIFQFGDYQLSFTNIFFQKSALTQTKESTKDEERLQEIEALKEKHEAKNIKQVREEIFKILEKI